jgi:hypothetical protein
MLFAPPSSQASSELKAVGQVSEAVQKGLTTCWDERWLVRHASDAFSRFLKAR